MKTALAWRLGFALAALLIIVGGPQHPRGTMAQMLADPAWYPSHALVLAGFVALAAGLALFARQDDLTPDARRWTRLALLGTAGQVLEMTVHTAAAVDHGNLVAGHATPVLTTHLWLSVLLYPVFAATISGFILVTSRGRLTAPPWLAWLGIIGAVAHGLAPVLVIAVRLEAARLLFPMVMLFALWLVMAAAWPRASHRHRAPVQAAG